MDGLINNVKALVEEVYSVEDMASRSRKKNYVFARHTYCGLLRKYTNEKLSFAKIAARINRDHATAMHSCNVNENLNETHKEYRERYRYCEYILITISGFKIEDPLGYIRQNLNECTNKQLEGIVKLMKECVVSNSNKNQWAPFPVDYTEMLQEKIQPLSQKKCEGLLTLLENYI